MLSVDPLTWDLFSGCTTVSAQLRDWQGRVGTSRSRPLHHFLELFMEAQERALSNLNERASELEHLKVQQGAVAGPNRYDVISFKIAFSRRTS